MDTLPRTRALDQLFAREAPGLAGFLRRQLPADAVEDALQETMLRAWQHRARYDRSRPAGPWLVAIARRVVLDRARRGDREPTLEALGDALDPGGTDPQGDAERQDEIDAVRRGLLELEPVARAVFEAFYGGGCSIQEITEEMKLPTNTVKSHLRRARQRLARNLQGSPDDDRRGGDRRREDRPGEDRAGADRRSGDPPVGDPRTRHQRGEG